MPSTKKRESWLSSTKQWTRWKIDYLLLFILMAIYYGHLQWHNYIGDPDGFYHTKIALWLRQGILLKTLPWMQFTTLRDKFTDHHLLYHLLLSPFTLFSNPLIGVKIATVLFSVLMALTFYWLLKKLHVVWPFIFTLLLVTLEGLSFRLSLVKANSLSLLLIFVLIYALHKRKCWLLALLGFIFIWLYGGWPLAIFISIIYIIVDKIYHYYYSEKLRIFWHKTINTFRRRGCCTSNINLFISLMSGIILGLIINPYWPHNLYFYYQQIIQIGIINMGNQFPVGGEWYGADFMSILSAAPHIFIIGAITSILVLLYYKKISQTTWFSFILAFIFLLLTMKSRRYVEYFLPFLLLYVACSVSDLVKIIKWKAVIKFWEESGRYLQIYMVIIAFAFCTLIMPPVFEKILNTQPSKRIPLNRFQAAGEWLKNNTPEHSIVFHSDWDEWPMLFYYDDHNYYLVGLDPTFMYDYDKKLHQLFINISTGQASYNVAKQIKDNFSADFVFVEKRGHGSFITNLNNDDGAAIAYEDEDTIIYKIN